MMEQPALVAGSLVRMDQALASGAVDDRHGSPVGRFGIGPVAGPNRLDHFLDVGPHPGA